MRCFLAAALLVGCGASVDGPANGIDSGAGDGNPPPIDSSIDAPPDAPRVCAGGDAHVAAPDGTCIVMFNQPKTFADAAAACILFGSKLAVLTDAQLDATARGLIGTTNVYIGLDDQTTEGTFVWSDGTPLVFKNFAMGEPNNANNVFQEDCVIIAAARAGWDDRPCAPDPATTTPGQYAYLCTF